MDDTNKKSKEIADYLINGTNSGELKWNQYSTGCYDITVKDTQFRAFHGRLSIEFNCTSTTVEDSPRIRALVNLLQKRELEAYRKKQADARPSAINFYYKKLFGK